MSAAVKFTPGPWRAAVSEDGYAEVIAASGCRVIDGIAMEAGASFGPEQEANAHLVAAAPDLYEACAAALADLDAAMHGSKPPMNQIALSRALRAALAKARGEG